MNRVLAQGAFDVLLPAHLHYLRESKSLGDSLWVAITPDSARCERVIQVDQSRRELVESLGPVDTAVIGSETGVADTLSRIEPDIVALCEETTSPSWIDYLESKCWGRIDVVRVDPYRPSQYELTTLPEIKAHYQARQE